MATIVILYKYTCKQVVPGTKYLGWPKKGRHCLGNSRADPQDPKAWQRL